MKNRILLLVMVLAAISFDSPSAVGQTSNRVEFAYQGRLKVGGGTPDPGARFDLRFRLFDASSGGNQLDESYLQTDVDTNGLFTVVVDAHPIWGSSGTVQWVELGARRSGGSSSYVTLSPRQRVSPVPSALHAQHADVARSFTNPIGYAQLPAGVARLDAPQTFTAPPTFMPATGPPFVLGLGTTSRVANLNADMLDGLDATNFWRRSLVDGAAKGVEPVDVPVEFHIQNTRVLRLERGLTVPNLIGGSSANTIAPAVSGSVIAGGGGQASPNSIAAPWAFIGAGLNNLISSNADHSIVTGGSGNQIATGARDSIIGGGTGQRIGINSINAGVFGGSANEVMANSRFAGVLLGEMGKVRESSDFAAVLSGEKNSIGPNAPHAVIMGGAANTLGDNARASFIGSGQQNLISTGAYSAAIVSGQNNQIGNGAYRSVLGGGNNNAIGPESYNAFLGGGGDNKIEFNAPYSGILAGNLNLVRSNAGWATVLGGVESIAGAPFAIAAGHGANAEHSGSIVLADGQYANFASSTANEFAVRAAGGVRLVTAGAGLFVDGQRLTSGGGALVIPDGSLTASKIADGAVLSELQDDDGEGSGLDADRLDGFSSEDFWRLAGNAGTVAGDNFLGTTDPQALELKVNNRRGLRLQPDIPFICNNVIPPEIVFAHSPSLVGGFASNSISAGVAGSVIAGGGAFDYPCLGGYLPNLITADMANIGGGLGNEVRGSRSTVGGGELNRIEHSANGCVIAGGSGNLISSTNVVASAADGSTISGGSLNEIRDDSNASTISGGSRNLIESNINFATIGGGEANEVAAQYATISGGTGNLVSDSATHAVIAGGWNNAVAPSSAAGTVSGGYQNVIGVNAPWSTIGGGQNNLVTNAPNATIGGGSDNRINPGSAAASIAGGQENTASAIAACVPGGLQAHARLWGQQAYAGGRFAQSGDAQTSTMVVRGTTSDATPRELYLDGTDLRMHVPRGGAWTFDILVVGRESGGASAGYKICGVIENNNTGDGRCVLVGAPEVAFEREQRPAWNVTVEADDATDSLVIKVTGESGRAIRWVATVRTVEVIF